MGFTKLKEAFDRVQTAGDAYRKVVKKEFRPDTTVRYTHGGRWREVTVVETHWDRVLVRGVTGSKYWLDASRFIE